MSPQTFLSTSGCSWGYIFINDLPWARRTEVLSVDRLNSYCEEARRTPTWVFGGHLTEEMKATDQVKHRLIPSSRTTVDQICLEILIPMFGTFRIISQTALPCGAMRRQDPKTAKVQYVLEHEGIVNDNDLLQHQKRRVNGNDYLCELFSQDEQCREAVDKYETDMMTWRRDLDRRNVSAARPSSSHLPQTNIGTERRTPASSNSSTRLEGDDERVASESSDLRLLGSRDAAVGKISMHMLTKSHS